MDWHITAGDESPQLLKWITRVTIALFCVAGAASIAGWIPASMGYSGEDAGWGKAKRSPVDPANAGAGIARDQPETRSNDQSIVAVKVTRSN